VAIDDFSRELYADILPDKAQHSAACFLASTVAQCPYQIGYVFSPNVCWCNIQPSTEEGFMGQILHGSAKTTHAIRTVIQRSQATLKELAQQYDINPKTVAKWRKRDFVDDAPMGPKKPASTVLTAEEEAMCVAFRRHTLCCRWMIACTPCSQRFRICPDQLCTAVINATASAGCRMLKETNRQRRSSRNIPLDTSTLTLPKCGPKKENSICSLP